MARPASTNAAPTAVTAIRFELRPMKRMISVGRALIDQLYEVLTESPLSLGPNTDPAGAGGPGSSSTSGRHRIRGTGSHGLVPYWSA